MIVFLVSKQNRSGHDKKKNSRFIDIFKSPFLAISAIVTFFLTTFGTALTLSMSAVDLKDKTSPSLAFSAIGGPGQNQLGLMVENIGAGKLIIDDVKIHTRDKRLISNSQFQMQREFNLPPGEFNFNFLMPGQSVNEKQQIWMIKAKQNNKLLVNKFVPMLDNISIETCVCSLRGYCQVKISGVQIPPTLQCRNKNFSSRISYGIKDTFKVLFNIIFKQRNLTSTKPGSLTS